MFTSALFIIAEKWKYTKCPSTMNEWTKCGISVQWSIIQQKKEWSTDTHYDMYEPWKSDAKRMKPDTEVFPE